MFECVIVMFYMYLIMISSFTSVLFFMVCLVFTLFGVFVVIVVCNMFFVVRWYR